MKKIILSLLFGVASVFTVLLAQDPTDPSYNPGGSGSGSGSGGCVTICLTDLADCLANNGINYSVVQGSNGQLILTATGSPPPGQINSCIVHYNQDRSSCPEAPVVVNASSSTSYSGGKKYTAPTY
jgi:hypothetical protein